MRSQPKSVCTRMYPSEMREIRYKNKNKSIYLVYTGKYWFATGKVRTFSPQYVVSREFCTQYIPSTYFSGKYVPSTYLEKIVRIKYVLEVKKHVLGRSSTKWYSTIDRYVPSMKRYVPSTYHGSRFQMKVY